MSKQPSQIKTSAKSDNESTLRDSILNTTLPVDPEEQVGNGKKQGGGWLNRLRPSHTDSNHRRPSNSISDSGPYVYETDPVTGKSFLRKNPHWPNEDSAEAEKDSKGAWAFGSMMGEQKRDFGGTTG